MDDLVEFLVARIMEDNHAYAHVAGTMGGEALLDSHLPTPHPHRSRCRGGECQPTGSTAGSAPCPHWARGRRGWAGPPLLRQDRLR